MADTASPAPAPAAPAPAAPDTDPVMQALTQADNNAAAQPAAQPGAQPAPAPQAQGQQPSGGIGNGVSIHEVTAADLKTPENEAAWAAQHPGSGGAVQDPSSFLDAAVGGATQGVLAAKDFLTGGAPAEADRSAPRQQLDKEMDDLTQDSLANSLVAGISQFGIGMLGVGKLAAAAEAVPVAGEAISAAGSAIGRWAESGKAATVGATFFDPHSANVANIVQKVPALANPVTQFLASSPDDGDALGRVKNAMASIGLDAAVTGVFAAGMKVVKAMRSGDTGAIAAAHGELDAAMQNEQGSREAIRNPPEEAPEEPQEAPPNTQANATGIPKDETVSGPSGGNEKVSVVQSPTAGAPGGKLPPKPSLINLSDEQVNSLIEHSRADSDAIIKYGSWQSAIDAGHVFGDPNNRVPWQKFGASGNVDSVTQSLDELTARVADTLKGEFDEAKGGDVVGDAVNSQMVQQRAALWNEDPSALLGLLQAAGKHSIQLRANMDAAYLIGQRAMQDAYTLAARINAGYLEEFGGSRPAALAAFKQVQEIAATAYAQGNAMSANAGRALRGMRGDFQPNPTDIAALNAVDPEVMLQVMQATKGDPRAIVKALQPKLWEPGGMGFAAKQFGEAAQFLLINNLISNPLTHAVILATNTYQVASRPMERYIGSLATGEAGGAIRQQAMKQYTYMASSLYDSFHQAVAAFRVGDSIMAPHSVEIGAASTNLGQTVAQLPWKDFDSVPNILYNTLTFAAKAAGLPSRFVGAQDELVKQIVYRGKVLADAHVEGATAGLDGPALTAHVQQALTNAYDAAGRATNTTALNEARIATFQQDLPETGSFMGVGRGLPTLGKSVQNFVNNYPPAKVILPFVRTPANLFRNGVKLTPVLAMFQAEYQDAIRGALGPEQQAQAVGQMAMGSLFMGTAALLAYEGRITGSGPSDPHLRTALLNTGWRPYSFTIPHPDGSLTYVQFGRFDPIAMPFGMMADIMDIAQHPDPVIQSKAESMAQALATGLLKSMTDKLYLQNLSQIIEGVTNPDASLWKVAGSYASNYVPFASALRMGNPDPYMREARTFIDQAKRGIPGFSESVPARRDAFGEPVTAHKGIWLTDSGSVVDHEVTRMATEQGLTLGGPTPHATGGVDLRNLTMMDGSNAFDKLQELSAQPAPGVPRMKDAMAKLIESEEYKNAPDGPDSIRGTRLSMMLDLAHRYRSAASRIVSADPNVRTAETAQRRAVAAAYAAKRPNPTPGNRQSELLQNMGAAFGVDMHSLIGATGAPTPSPVAGPTAK